MSCLEDLVRDGAISIRHDVLAKSMRDGKSPPPNSYQVTFYTEQGKAAFEHLPRYFGL